MTPPGNLAKVCGLHWVVQYGQYADFRTLWVLQWNPSSLTWTRQNEFVGDLGVKPINVDDCTYLKPVELPSLEEIHAVGRKL